MGQPDRTAVWTDFGGVLTPPAGETLRTVCERVGVPLDQFGTAMYAVAQAHGADDVMAPLDTPILTEAEWGREMEAALLERFGTRADLSNISDKWFADRPANEAWAGYLRTLRERGCFVGMLSNMVPSFEPHWRAMVPPEGLFDDLVLSYEVGTRKPHRAIFELAEQRAGVPGSRCVLVDDLEPHCQAARAAGWQAVHFVSAEAAAAELDELLDGLARAA